MDKKEKSPGPIRSLDRAAQGRAVKAVVIIVFALVYLLALRWANTGWNGYTTTDSSGTEYERAKVLSVLADNTVTDESYENYSVGSTVLELKIQSGRYKGDVVEVTNYLSALYNVDVGEGDWVTVRIDTTGVGVYAVSIYNYYRTPWLLLFVAVFALALVALGGFQGLMAFLGLAFAFVSTVFLLVPLTLRGYPSVPMTLVLVAVATVVGFYLLGGLAAQNRRRGAGLHLRRGLRRPAGDAGGAAGAYLRLPVRRGGGPNAGPGGKRPAHPGPAA